MTPIKCFFETSAPSIISIGRNFDLLTFFPIGMQMQQSINKKISITKKNTTTKNDFAQCYNERLKLLIFNYNFMPFSTFHQIF